MVLLVVMPVISLLLHLHVFTLDLRGVHVWRQTQTQQIIRNFAEEDFNILHPRVNHRGELDPVFRQEFPLMQWVYAVFFKLFGDHIIITRILSFLMGIFTALGMYRLGRRLFREPLFALVLAWAFYFAPNYFYYTLNPLPDLMCLCLSVWGLAVFVAWVNKRSVPRFLLAIFLLCLSVTIKAFYGVFLFVPAVWFVVDLFRGFSGKKFLHATLAAFTILVMLIPAYLWYLSAYENLVSGNILEVTSVSNGEQLKKYAGQLAFNLGVIVPKQTVGIVSIFFLIGGAFLIAKNKLHKNRMFIPLVFLVLAPLAYLIIKLQTIGTYHDYYLHPFYPGLMIVTAYGFGRGLFAQKRIVSVGSLTALALLPLVAFVTENKRWSDKNLEFNPALLLHRDELRRAVPDTERVIVMNDASHYIWFYYLRKRGWALEEDRLSAPDLRDKIRLGAKYLYSDSEKVNGDSAVLALVERVVLEVDGVKVMQLKEE